MTQRPLPVADEMSAPFWAATATHQLSIARCSKCAMFSHPPDVVCPRCHHTDPQFVFESVSGRGTVRSWVVMRQSFLPGFEDDVPFVLVDVALVEDADLRLIGRLVDGPDATLAIGAHVSVVFEDLADGVSVPAFSCRYEVSA